MKNRYEIFKLLDEKKEFCLNADVFYDFIYSEIFDDDTDLVAYLKNNGFVNENDEVILPAGTKLTYKGVSNPGGLGYIYFRLNDCEDNIPDIAFNTDFDHNEDLLKAIGLDIELEEGLIPDQIIGDINLNLDAGGQSVGFLGGTGGAVTNNNSSTDSPLSVGSTNSKESEAELKEDIAETITEWEVIYCEGDGYEKEEQFETEEAARKFFDELAKDESTHYAYLREVSYKEDLSEQEIVELDSYVGEEDVHENLNEAPDKYGLPTDDELADEEERERAELEKRLSAKRAQRDAEKKAAADKEEADKKAAQEREQRLASVEGKVEEIKTLVAKEDEDTLFENLFNVLVPDRGPAETLAGELIRAWMRVMYRSWNDGDVFFEGYGLETCGPEAAFVCENANEQISKMIRDLAEDCCDEAAQKEVGSSYKNYDDKCKEIAQKLADSILSDYAETLVTKNTFDCNKDFDGADYWASYIPKYEYELYIADEVQKHVEAYNISIRDIISEVENWLNYENIFYGARVDSGWNDTILISDLTLDGYREIESWDSHNHIWNEYIEELNNEYGDPDEYDRDYDDEDDDYEDDVDESLNETKENPDYQLYVHFDDDDIEAEAFKDDFPEAKEFSKTMFKDEERAISAANKLNRFINQHLDNEHFKGFESVYVVKIWLREDEEFQTELIYKTKESINERIDNIDLIDSQEDYIYLFPICGAMEPISDCEDFKLTLLGKNYFKEEKNYVVKGSRENLEAYADYLGYELHPDYLYVADEFAGDIVNLNESSSNDHIEYKGIDITVQHEGNLEEGEAGAYYFTLDGQEYCCDYIEDCYKVIDAELSDGAGARTWGSIYLNESDIEDTTSEEKCESSRFYVYDDNGEVVSDGFEYYEDASDFAIERGYDIIKQHCYYRETPDSTLKPLGEPKVVSDKGSERIDEYYVDASDGWFELDSWNQAARNFDDLDYEIKNCVKSVASDYQGLANEIRELSRELDDVADDYEQVEERESEYLDENYSKQDLLNAVMDAYGYNKTQALKYIKTISEKAKEELVRGFKQDAKKNFNESLEEENKLEPPFNTFYRPMTEEDMMQYAGMTFEEIGSPVEEADDNFTSLGWYIAKDEYFNNMTNIYAYLSDSGLEIAELVKEKGKEKPFLAYTINNRIFPITKDELQYLFWDEDLDALEEALPVNTVQQEQPQEEDPALCPKCGASFDEEGKCPKCTKPDAELIEAKSDNKFEVLYYTELDDDGQYAGDPVTVEFDTRKEAIAFYKKHFKDTDKYGWWITERDEDWEVVRDIIIEGKLTSEEAVKGNKIKGFTKEEAQQYAKELSKITYERGSYVDVDLMYNGDECCLYAYIEDGDWKHDHLAFEHIVRRYFMEKNIEVKINGEVVDSEDTFSDCYSVSYEIKKVK